MADEYILKEYIINKCKEHRDFYISAWGSFAAMPKEDKVACDAYATIWSDVVNVEAADVHPVNQWISVKDRLPEPEKEVLVWYRYTWGAGFTSYRFGISRWYSNIKRWYEGCLPKDIDVLYWQPLPEPPKQ